MSAASVKQTVYAGVLLAFFVAIGGAGIATRDIALKNSIELRRLDKNLSEQNCCEIEDCNRIISDVTELSLAMQAHEDLWAHREAELRIRSFDEHISIPHVFQQPVGER